MKKFKVTLGLGRMSNHHPKTYEIDAKDEMEATALAKQRYHREVAEEIGKDARIWGKMLTISDVEKMND